MADETDPAQNALLLAFLKDRDVACPLCQFNLRNLTTTTCPECGKAIELGVKAREVSVQPWATLVAALSLAAGLGLFLLGIGLSRGWPWRDEPEAPVFYAFIAMIPLAISALAMRHKFLRLPRGTQFRIAALVVCLVFMLFLIQIKTF